MSRRLVPASAVTAWEAQLHDAAVAAMAGQRRAVFKTLGMQPGAHRANIAGAAGRKAAAGAVVVAATVWSSTTWRRMVDTHVAPVAATVARQALLTAQAVLPAAHTMGMPTSWVGTAQSMVDQAYSSGDAIGGRVNAAARGAASIGQAADDAGSAMDSAVDILDNVVGSMASGAANLSTTDVTSYLGGYFGNLYDGATKTWNSMDDDKVRPDHADADGDSVALNDVFVVGGETMVGPHDPSASDDQTTGCRCFLSTDGVLPDDGTTSDLGDEDNPPDDVAESLDLGEGDG